jgi:hypothetical protein
MPKEAGEFEDAGVLMDWSGELEGSRTDGLYEIVDEYTA